MPSQKPSSQGRNNAKLTQPTKIPKTNSYLLVNNQIKEKKSMADIKKKKNKKQYKKRKTCGQILRPQMFFFFFFF